MGDVRFYFDLRRCTYMPRSKDMVKTASIQKETEKIGDMRTLNE